MVIPPGNAVVRLPLGRGLHQLLVGQLPVVSLELILLLRLFDRRIKSNMSIFHYHPIATYPIKSIVISRFLSRSDPIRPGQYVAL